MFFRFYDIAKDFVLVLSKIVYVKGRREENWGGDERWIWKVRKVRIDCRKDQLGIWTCVSLA
jgi:hypothetical protein